MKEERRPFWHQNVTDEPNEAEPIWSAIGAVVAIWLFGATAIAFGGVLAFETLRMLHPEMPPFIDLTTEDTD